MTAEGMTKVASPVLSRVLPLLAAPPAVPDLAHGYLDLAEDAAATSAAQSPSLWSAMAPVYERYWRPVGFNLAKGWPFGPDTAAEFAQARAALRLARPGSLGRPAATVLDVACGPGNLTRALAAGTSGDGLVVGLDLSHGMLARAVADTLDEHVAYVRASALGLPFADASFDAVSCYGALYLFDDPWSVVAEMARVLRPGGRIAILTSRRPGLPLTGRAAQELARLGGGHLFTAAELTGALERHGFTAIARRSYPLMQTVSATAGARPGE